LYPLLLYFQPLIKPHKPIFMYIIVHSTKEWQKPFVALLSGFYALSYSFLAERTY